MAGERKKGKCMEWNCEKRKYENMKLVSVISVVGCRKFLGFINTCFIHSLPTFFFKFMTLAMQTPFPSSS
jgi:hypothetical protein